MARVLELIEDSQGKLSTPPSVVWIAVIILSIQIIIDTVNGNTNETVIGIYATLIAGVYGIKKTFDSSEVRAQIKADATPSTVISDNTKVTTELGDINIKPRKKR